MWLLAPGVEEKYTQFEHSGAVPPMEFLALRSGGNQGSGSQLLSVRGGDAEISVRGILTNRPDFFARMFGGGNSTYPEIVSALIEAEADPDVKKITLAIDSPGGQFDGLFDVMDAIKGVSKPVEALVFNQASSAAFGIASQADRVVAANRAARLGSVGILFRGRVFDEEVNIASTDAPKKAPDLKTEEGQAIIREQLDGLHELFVEAIADGRKTTVKRVNTRFGQGAEMLAEDALSRGMIDAIAEPTFRAVDNPKTKRVEGNMDITTLKKDHAGVYAEVLAEGKKEGTEQERDRVLGHLTMGEGCGAMDTAVKAIKEGTGDTAQLRAEYFTAGQNRKDVATREAEDAETAKGAEGVAATAQSAGESVMDMVEKKLNMEPSAVV